MWENGGVFAYLEAAGETQARVRKIKNTRKAPIHYTNWPYGPWS